MSLPDLIPLMCKMPLARGGEPIALPLPTRSIASVKSFNMPSKPPSPSEPNENFQSRLQEPPTASGILVGTKAAPKKKQPGVIGIDARVDLLSPCTTPSVNTREISPASCLGRDHLNQKITILLGVPLLLGENKEHRQKRRLRFWHAPPVP